MNLKLSKNWIAKLLCLLLATGIWFLIKGHLKSTIDADDPPPRAWPVNEDTLEPQ